MCKTLCHKKFGDTRMRGASFQPECDCSIRPRLAHGERTRVEKDLFLHEVNNVLFRLWYTT